MSLFSKKPRLRMAPSPTGFLHLGTLRTALFGYLLAKKWKGDFILRIEDTDQKREVEGAADSLIDIFGRLGIVFDEGPHIGGKYGPYIQSERKDMYREHAEKLVENGEAYYCFCTSERLEKMREELAAAHQPPRYDRTCRSISIDEARTRVKAGEAHVVRHAMPLEGDIQVHDELRGDIVFKAADLDDYVLLKSDGLPTYQLASVVDDHLMEITHVTRGDEWIPSLPKNISLYRSFGWEAPKFIHLPLILNKTGGKLSKRQGDVFVEQYLDKGYLKEALINFCALLGWRPKTDQEIFTLGELEKLFDIDGMGTSPAVFDEEKLNFLNGHYIREKNSDDLLELSRPFLAELVAQAPAAKQSDDFLKKVITIEQPRLKYLSELGENVAFFFQESIDVEPSLLLWKKQAPTEAAANLNELVTMLEPVSEQEWSTDALETSITAQLKSAGQGLGDYLWPMRVALSGRKASPGPFEIAAVIGKAQTLAKMSRAASRLS